MKGCCRASDQVDIDAEERKDTRVNTARGLRRSMFTSKPEAEGTTVDAGRVLGIFCAEIMHADHKSTISQWSITVVNTPMECSS